MFFLLFLLFIKKGWQFFVLYFKFLYELAPCFIILYFSIYLLKITLYFGLFVIFFIFNISYSYLLFYLNILLVLFFLLFDFILFLYTFLLQDFHNSFNLFFYFILFILIFKLLLWFLLFLLKKIFSYLNYYIFDKRTFITKYFWSVVYEEKKVPILSINWRYITTFLRIKHYKATILCLYILYLPLVLKLIFMDFNPVC